MLKGDKYHEKRDKMGPNGVFGQFLDVFVVVMTKKCTKTNNFATSSVKNVWVAPSLSPKIQGGSPHPLPPP
jgi:hypothetical protein